MAPEQERQRLNRELEDKSPNQGCSPERFTAVEQLKQPPLPGGEAVQRSLFVHSLPASATTDSLTKLFSQSFPLKHAVVISDPSSKLPKGYGFVTFTDPSDALAAIQTFNGALFDGKRVKVELAEPRSRGVQLTDGATHPTPELSSPRLNKRTKTQYGRQDALGEPSTQLIIRNLPWTISKPEQLAVLFRSYGKIKKATIPKKEHGLSAGFGFVVLRGRKNAEKALMEVNGKVVDGRTLAVDWAVRKDVWESLHPNGVDDTRQEESVPVRNADLEEVVEGNMTGSEGTGEQTEEEHELDSRSSAGYEYTGYSGESSSRGTDIHKDEQNYSSTLFIRNVPFTATDESLNQLFASFGPVRYARTVIDPSTQRSKGTAFVCFWNEADAIECLRAAPRDRSISMHSDKVQTSTSKQTNKKSVLQDTNADTSGRFTLDGRALHISRAVDKGEATRLTAAGHTFRDVRDRDKRRLYLLGEGTIPSNTPLYNQLAPSEIALREESARQRQNLIKNNPALHLSLTRLSVRNLSRNINSKELKALARQAVVGFSRDVKAGLRQALSREELSRAGDLMREAERARKAKGKGIVKQSKVVFESTKGGKVSEGSGAGRSKGYGFIEYTSHRWALMGLRWLNGHAAEAQPKGATNTQSSSARKKRLIVEFAIENAQVVGRRQERETQSLNKSRSSKSGTTPQPSHDENPQAVKDNGRRPRPTKRAGAKRKRSLESSFRRSSLVTDQDDTDARERLAKKQKIIGRKRISRRARKVN